jgi:hypothetical protein
VAPKEKKKKICFKIKVNVALNLKGGRMLRELEVLKFQVKAASSSRKERIRILKIVVIIIL